MTPEQIRVYNDLDKTINTGCGIYIVVVGIGVVIVFLMILWAVRNMDRAGANGYKIVYPNGPKWIRIQQHRKKPIRRIPLLRQKRMG